MITFHETVDSVERLNEMLKSSAEVRAAVKHALDYMADFSGMLAYAHTKGFKDVGEALEYIDKVLVPRLAGIHDALASHTDPHIKRLEQAQELSNRLLLRLQMLSEDGSGGILP
jgi:hypothetical protein